MMEWTTVEILIFAGMCFTAGMMFIACIVTCLFIHAEKKNKEKE